MGPATHRRGRPITEEIPGSGTGDIRLSTGDWLDLGGYGPGTAELPDNVEVPIGRWIKEPDGACPARRWVTQQVDPQGR